MHADYAAEQWWAEARWPDGPVCHHCGGQLSERPRHHGRRLSWWCSACRKVLSVTTGTLLQGSRLSLDLWQLAMSATSRTPGDLSRLLGVSRTAAARLSQVLQVVTPNDWMLHRQPERRAQLLLSADPSTAEPVQQDEMLRLSAAEKRVLAGLRCRRLGASVAAVAVDTGVSERHVRRCLERLSDLGLVTSTDESGRFFYTQRPVELWHLAKWDEALLCRLPEVEPVLRDDGEHVPGEFWSAFWSMYDPANLRLTTHGAHIAQRLLFSQMFEAEMWGWLNLPQRWLKDITKNNWSRIDGQELAPLAESAMRMRDALEDMEVEQSA